MKELKIQTGILLRKREFLIGFSLFLFYVLISFFFNLYSNFGKDIGSLLAPYEYDALSSWSSFQWYYNQFFPFVVIIASGFGFFQDKRSGEIYLLQYRMGRKKYYITKSVAIFLVGAMAFIIPFLLGLLLDWIAFPNTVGYPDYGTAYSDSYFRFGMMVTGTEFYMEHPWLYHIFMTLGIGGFVGIVSVFVSVFAFCKLQYRILYFLPFYIICFLLDISGQWLPDLYLSIYYYTMLEVSVNSRIPFFLFFLGSLLLGISYLILRNQFKKEIDAE